MVLATPDTIDQVSEQLCGEKFHSSTIPMWVFDQKKLSFLIVNQTAIDSYGFTREEFLSRTILDIRPREDIQRLLHETEAPAPVVEGDPPGADRPPRPRRIMVAQILADARQGMAHRDAQLLQALRLADARQFQQLWRVDGTRAHDDFAGGTGFPHVTVRVQGYRQAVGKDCSPHYGRKNAQRAGSIRRYHP